MNENLTLVFSGGSLWGTDGTHPWFGPHGRTAGVWHTHTNLNLIQCSIRNTSHHENTLDVWVVETHSCKTTVTLLMIWSAVRATNQNSRPTYFIVLSFELKFCYTHWSDRTNMIIMLSTGWRYTVHIWRPLLANLVRGGKMYVLFSAFLRSQCPSLSDI